MCDIIAYVALHGVWILLSSVSTLTRDIDIAIPSIRPSVCLSVCLSVTFRY